ncbi:hypothetical protein HPB48_001439 [Haemaphysalis longicornis]|uniref:Cadherin domain-containing protein n=1 Tax=Haemaphysalis longicornis TaxID=44386 RepID=A0A9J6FEV0_HAELO|nr:hypothetical protein HPB48_001439 [Haemaphysalis longicornis]
MEWGSRVMTVRTRDEDQDVIEYGIEPAVFLDGSSYFRINKRSGEVFLTRSLAGQAGSDYYLFITAYDGHQTAKIEVYVKVVKPSSGMDGSELLEPPPRPFPGGGLGRPPSGHFAPPAPPPQLGPGKKRPSKEPPPPQPPRPPARPTGTGQVRPDPGVEDPADTEEKGGVNGGTQGTSGGIDMTSTVLPIVAVVGFAPLVALFFWLMHRRCHRDDKLKPKKSTDRLDSNFSHNFDLSPATLYNPRARRALSNRYEPDFLSSLSEHSKWEFPRHHLRFIGILGEGCFGQVWKCEAMNITGSDEPVIVAVKTLKGSTPYPGLAAAEVMRRVRDGYRLEKPEHCKREMYNIMYYCWDPDPNERPSFSELTCLLDKLLVSENDYIELDRFPDHSYYNITNLSGEKL